MFIVQGKPREPEGIEKATADSREEALETASDFLNRGFPFVTIVADGRVYTVDEFAMTVKSAAPPSAAPGGVQDAFFAQRRGKGSARSDPARHQRRAAGR